MKKIKRKQILFGGRDDQYVKGNGELGDIDRLVVEISTKNEISQLADYEHNMGGLTPSDVVVNKQAIDICRAIEAGKTVEWYFCYTLVTDTSSIINNDEEQKCIRKLPLQIGGRCSFSNHALGELGQYLFMAILYGYDINLGVLVEIRASIRVTRSINSVSMYPRFYFTPLANYESLAEINNESLNYKAGVSYLNPSISTLAHTEKKVSINVHDGFYFPNAIQDYDGNWYGAVVIGEQVWLAENLRTTHYHEGTPIDPTHYYIKENVDITKYGILYNDIVKGQDKVAPIGFRVPKIADWNNLFNYVTSQRRHNGCKSLSSREGWNAPIVEGEDEDTGPQVGIDLDLNNSTGFNAYPAGSGPSFANFGNLASFWASDITQTNNIRYHRTYDWKNNSNKNSYTQPSVSITGLAHSIRCISELTPVQFRNWYVAQYGSMQHLLIPQQDTPGDSQPVTQVQVDWNQTDPTALDFIKNKPALPKAIFWAYTDSAEISSVKTITLIDPLDGFVDGSYIVVDFRVGGVSESDQNRLLINTLLGQRNYFIVYRGVSLNNGGFIKKADKVLFFCYQNYAHIISIDRWGMDLEFKLPITTKYGANVALSIDDDYSEVLDTTNKSPVGEGWYEIYGTEPNTVYGRSTDKTPVVDKTYFTPPTYAITSKLLDQDGSTLGQPKTINLPLDKLGESFVSKVVWCYFSESDPVNHTGTMTKTINELIDLTLNGYIVCLTRGSLIYRLSFVDNVGAAFTASLPGTDYVIKYHTDDQLWHFDAYNESPPLVSGITIKTINGESLLGAGNIRVGQMVECILTEIDNVTYTLSMTPRELSEQFGLGVLPYVMCGSNIYILSVVGSSIGCFVSPNPYSVSVIEYSTVDELWHRRTYNYQANLQNEVNIKSINGTSLLGAGSINIEGLPPVTSADDGKTLVVRNGVWTVE